MGGEAARNKKTRRRRMGIIGGLGSILLVSGGLMWYAIGGTDTSVSGDARHPLGTLDATELELYNLDAMVTSDASA